jgi:hypothetical protein
VVALPESALLPFTTFGEIAALGLGVEIRCPTCYRITKIDPSDEALRDRPATLPAPRRYLCDAVERPARPVDPLWQHRMPRCVPVWEIKQARRDRPPWRDIFGRRGARLACPICRAVLATSWSGGPGMPHTDGYERRSLQPPTDAGIVST